MALDHRVLSDVINEGDCIVVGVSGGADSMCLLDLLCKHKSICNYQLFVVHVNHHIRDKEAERDEKFVERWCQEKKISFICKHINTIEYAKQNSMTTEQAARELRYKVFDEEIKKLKANKLFVAHNKDDQAETILMHIARGSSMRGARGMAKNKKNIYRPLLAYSRTEIELYNRSNGVDFVTDSSNLENKYTRNRIRREVLPKFKEAYPNIVDSLCLFAERCSRDDSFIEGLVPYKLLSVNKDSATINIEIVNLHYALSSRLIKKLLKKLMCLQILKKSTLKKSWRYVKNRPENRFA